MRKIYIVTSGSYSDYSIRTVFESEEKANEFVETKNRKSGYTDYDIEEYVIADSVEDYKLEDYEVITATLRDYFSYTEYTNNTGDDPKEASITTRYFSSGTYGSELGVRITRIKTDDMNEEKARKICAELLSKLQYAVKVEGIKPREAVALFNGELDK
jgi:hypothetical protein